MMKVLYPCIAFVAVALSAATVWAQTAEPTYAEKLGWPKGTRALILHVDDAGMSYDSDLGAMKAIDEGASTSLSVMMPCPWVPHIVDWIKKTGADAGLHLTMNAEWDDYRWGPVAGKRAVPGLTDEEGCLWDNVRQVVEHATPDEVETEIRAQLDRARSMGFEPTHLDSHMGALFATDEFMMRYIKVGMEEHIPVMFPGGHNYYAKMSNGERAGAQARAIGKTLWDAGLPVLDDLHNFSYDWKDPSEKLEKYIAAVHGLKPGVTMMIMHCTQTTEVFEHISGSGPTRAGDLATMLDPRFKQALEDEGIVLTTWRELMQRRQKVAQQESD